MAYPFAAAEVLTAANLNAMIGAPPQNAQTGTTYTLALLDAGKTVTLNNASPVAVTVPLQSSVTWIANTQINLLNIGAGLVTIAGDVGVTINGTPLTLETSKGGTLIRTASNTWTFVPTGGAGGKILQVVRATDSTLRSTTSTSFVDANISVTITPQKSTSAVLLVWSARLTIAGSGASGNFRGQTAITDSSNNNISGAAQPTFGYFGDTTLTNGEMYHHAAVIAYATPATTSAVTFKGRFKVLAASTTLTLENGNNTGQLYAIEVSA